MPDEEKKESEIKVIDRRRFILKEDGSVEKREGVEKQENEGKAKRDERVEDFGNYGRIPPVDFQTFISTLATTALIHLGHLPDPSTGEQIKNLDVAKYHIDIIDMLREKTKGNLSPKEKRFLDEVLHDLKLRFIEESQK